MTKKIKDYSGYELYDFLMDEQFKSWATGGKDELADHYWQSVMDCYPEKAPLILAAKQTAAAVKRSRNTDQDRKQLLWDRISREVDESPVASVNASRLRNFYKYAAVILIVMGTTVAIILNTKPAMVTVATGNGETRSLILPDSSAVQLAANSSITYSKTIHSDQIREITIHGEANLTVKHLNKNPSKVLSNERFIVHLKHAVDVEVLGTVFSVNDRRDKATVNLESGAVKVITEKNTLLLKPGQVAEMLPHQVAVIQKQNKPSVKRKWQNNTLVMDKTTAREVILILEDNYGIMINTESKALLDKQLDGIIPLNDETQALLILNSITSSQSKRNLNMITLIPD